MKIIRIFKAATLVAFSWAAQAQDTYIALANNYRLNTSNGTTTNLSAIPNSIPISYPAPDPRTVFDESGNVLFSLSSNSVYFAGFDYSNGGGSGGQSVFPLPGVCKKFCAVGTGPYGPPWGSYLRLSFIDASGVTDDINTTGVPTVNDVYLTTQGHHSQYGSVVSPANLNGEHYVYHVTGYVGGIPAACNVYRYTVYPNGTYTTTPYNYNVQLPHIGGRLKMSRDGRKIGYPDNNGNFVIFDVGTGLYSSYSLPVGTVVYGVEQYTYAGLHRWILSSQSNTLVVIEGVSGSQVLHHSRGAKSQLAVNDKGELYYGTGDPALGNGFLGKGSTFSPLGWGDILDPVYSNGNTFVVENNISGENSSTAFATASLDFKINGFNRRIPSSCSPQQIQCPSDLIFNFTTPVPVGQKYKLSWIETNMCGIPIPGSSLNYTDLIWKSNAGPIDLANYGNMKLVDAAAEDKYFVVSLTTLSVCSQSPGVAVQALIHIQPWGLKLTDWKISVNSSGGLADPGPTCQTALVGACNRYPLIEASFEDVDEFWMEISYFPNNNCNSTKIKIADGSSSPTIPSPPPNSNVIGLHNYVAEHSTNPDEYDDLWFRLNTNSLVEVKLWMKNSCGTTSKSGYFYNNSAVNCREIAEKSINDIMISPNPASNNVTVQLEDVYDKTVGVELFDILGKKVMTLVPESKMMTSNFKMTGDVSKLPAGMYNYVYTYDGQKRFGKIMILK